MICGSHFRSCAVAKKCCTVVSGQERKTSTARTLDAAMSQLVRRQDHPNTGRDALVGIAREVSQKAQVETAEKRKEKKTALRVRAGALHCLGDSTTTAKAMPTYHSVVVLPSIGIDLPLRMHCSL